MSSLLGTFKTLPPELQATFRAAVLAQPSIIKTIAAIGITEEEILEHVIELIKQEPHRNALSIRLSESKKGIIE